MDKFEFVEEKLQIWNNEGISWDSMKKFQVKYDYSSNRIVFPIKDLSGNIINVCGRTLYEDYKEKKLRKYTYFKPLGILDVIYGFSENINSVLDKNEYILFEGSKSVMLADSWGIYNTGALLTSHLNYYQMEILMKLGIRIVFALDEEVDISKDEYIGKLKYYCPIEKVSNKNGLLLPKMAPVDAGEDTWKTLYNERELVN